MALSLPRANEIDAGGHYTLVDDSNSFLIENVGLRRAIILNICGAQPGTELA
jgi:hypothetical protein